MQREISVIREVFHLWASTLSYATLLFHPLCFSARSNSLKYMGHGGKLKTPSESRAESWPISHFGCIWSHSQPSTEF